MMCVFTYHKRAEKHAIKKTKLFGCTMETHCFFFFAIGFATSPEQKDIYVMMYLFLFNAYKPSPSFIL